MRETIKMKCIQKISTLKQFKVHVQSQCNHPICNHTNKKTRQTSYKNISKINLYFTESKILQYDMYAIVYLSFVNAFIAIR